MLGHMEFQENNKLPFPPHILVHLLEIIQGFFFNFLKLRNAEVTEMAKFWYSRSFYNVKNCLDFYENNYDIKWRLGE